MKTFLTSSIALIPILAHCIFCNNSNEKNFNDFKGDKLIVANDTISLLQGAWGVDSTSNASFGIYHDSIYYPDPGLWYKYSIHADTLVIYSGKNIENKILMTKISTDSLVLKYLQVNKTITYRKRK